ncbi:thiol reductant ABC exporter subunit CydD [Ornithinimicrobium cavernae]|uniref:thiol reductant ABC exporter subunit CydD n=1 Tax=Ornithinimicrobium cavernae TaxID=2666047 RepID=UPI000D68E45E|nr:thiol reductant ABC exporter subunit CydD [Ornithinimicrobium cavernae]
MRPFDPALLRDVPAARLPVAALSVAGVAGGAVAVAQAVCLAWLASAVVTGAGVMTPLTWTVLLLLTRGLLSGGQEWLGGWAGHRVASGIRVQLLHRWARLPEGARPAPEVALTRATEGVASVEPYVARYLPALVAGAVVPVLSVVTLVVVDVWAALIVVLTLPLLPVFAVLIGKHTQAETERRWSALTDLSGHFLDVVRGLPTLVAYGRAERQVGVVAEVGRRHRLATVRTLRTAFLSTVALELLATISVALVAVCVGLRLAYGAMDLQVAMTAILLAPEAYWPVRRVGAEFHSAADGAAALEALGEGLAASPSTERAGERVPTPPGTSAKAVSTPPGPSAKAVSTPPGALPDEDVVAAGLSYHHPGATDTLRGLDLSSPSGPGLTALTGPSGAGKTTLLELLAGLRVPNEGSVQAPEAHLATQRPLLLPGSVRENLALAAPAATDGEMRLALGSVGLWEAIAGRGGLDTVLGDDGFGLSAGQRGRLALARALLSEAPLVLLDEPTAHVAPDTVAALRQVILELARRRRVIVATHDLELAALADQRWHLPLLGDPTSPGAPAGIETDLAGAPGAVESHVAARPVEEEAPPTGRGRWGRVSPRRRLWIAATIGGLATASGVALTATSGWLIVQASYQPVVLTLLVAVVGVRAFGLARPVLRYAERVLSHDVALAELAHQRTQVYRRLIPLTPARLGRRSRGDVLTAVVRDLDDVVDEQVRVVVPLVDTAIAGGVAALVVGAFLPSAGWVVAGGTLAVFLLGRAGQALEQRAHGRAVAHRGAVHRLTALVTSQLTAVQSVTGTTGGADQVVSRVARQQVLADRAVRSLSVTRGVMIAATWVLVSGAVGTTAWLAAVAHASGTLAGPVAALVTLTPMALAEAWTGLPDAFGARARAHAARDRLTAVLTQEPAVTDPRPPFATLTRHPALVADRLEASWSPEPRGHGTSSDLAATDLTLQPGDAVVLTGPNGVGKSTLLAVLARHLDPVAGSYQFDDADARRVELDLARALFAVVDDEPHAFAATVRGNLLLARPEAKDSELVAALHGADLGHWLSRLSDGLDTPLTGLSGGERTRLSVARGILSGRPVLLLDEPTAHLDEPTARRVLGRLASDSDRTTVVVSHGLRPAGWAEVDLSDGRPTMRLASR